MSQPKESDRIFSIVGKLEQLSGDQLKESVQQLLNLITTSPKEQWTHGADIVIDKVVKLFCSQTNNEIQALCLSIILNINAKSGQQTKDDHIELLCSTLIQSIQSSDNHVSESANDSLIHAMKKVKEIKQYLVSSSGFLRKTSTSSSNPNYDQAKLSFLDILHHLVKYNSLKWARHETYELIEVLHQIVGSNEEDEKEEDSVQFKAQQLLPLLRNKIETQKKDEKTEHCFDCDKLNEKMNNQQNELIMKDEKIQQLEFQKKFNWEKEKENENQIKQCENQIKEDQEQIRFKDDVIQTMEEKLQLQEDIIKRMNEERKLIQEESQNKDNKVKHIQQQLQSAPQSGRSSILCNLCVVETITVKYVSKIVLNARNLFALHVQIQRTNALFVRNKDAKAVQLNAKGARNCIAMNVSNNARLAIRGFAHHAQTVGKYAQVLVVVNVFVKDAFRSMMIASISIVNSAFLKEQNVQDAISRSVQSASKTAQHVIKVLVKHAQIQAFNVQVVVNNHARNVNRSVKYVINIIVRSASLKMELIAINVERKFVQLVQSYAQSVMGTVAVNALIQNNYAVFAMQCHAQDALHNANYAKLLHANNA
ncbi:MAG: hypothetical protein EZS28_006727 [Streblomastix strix]|uniref:Uncharacterized protein n=1 Tax=Streblomastix strix TaxID=222440 RepID=A0A5J4WUB9_9EUKA|nr:MAG: hypothetical protein EZS28_006727 [Streblomastix strix]